MTWIQPLSMEQWVINVFSGNPDYFGAIAVLVITGMAGFFRMNGIGLFFMLGLFVLMFSGYIGLNFLIVFAIIGGLFIGYSLSKIFR
jgi:hypothetical protein